MGDIVITGGAGFIGSAIVCELNKRGVDNILIVDELGCDERWRNLVNLRFADFVHKDDFISTIQLGDWTEKIDGIIHMGACTDTTETDADFLMWNNYEYTKIIAQWCVSNNKRLVYASSGATYGDGSQGFSDDHKNLHKLKPLNMYAYSKHLFDLWALRNNILDKIAGIKYFNVYGPNEYHKGEMRSVIHKAFEQIRATGKMKLFKSYNPKFADGAQKRDFVYVKDVVDMTIFLYNNPHLNGIFNCGMGKAHTFYEVVESVFMAVGKNIYIEYIDMPVNIREKYQYFTEAEMEKIREAGYEHRFQPIESAICDYVKNYLMSEDRYLNPEE
ncbi:ADP-glyceromanno-heptose 6-epimerase [bacterium]|nr:MAG: ADP-glyceromanno-heptose 6-epimerase [bacterium]